MTDLNVACQPAADGWTCEVTVADDDGSRTQHTVSVSQSELERYAGDDGEPLELVQASFRFLLEREPKESILRQFALSDIQRYFPEYPGAIAGRSGRSEANFPPRGTRLEP
jgi:hypothetical protein